MAVRAGGLQYERDVSQSWMPDHACQALVADEPLSRVGVTVTVGGEGSRGIVEVNETHLVQEGGFPKLVYHLV